MYMTMLPVYLLLASCQTVGILQSGLPLGVKILLTVLNYGLMAVGVVTVSAKSYALKRNCGLSFIVGSVLLVTAVICSLISPLFSILQIGAAITVLILLVTAKQKNTRNAEVAH